MMEWSPLKNVEEQNFNDSKNSLLQFMILDMQITLKQSIYNDVTYHLLMQNTPITVYNEMLSVKFSLLIFFKIE